MNFKVHQAVFAILDLTIDMAAKQRAVHNLFVQSISSSTEQYKETLNYLNQEVKEETALIRAKLLQYAEIDIDDLLNGVVDI